MNIALRDLENEILEKNFTDEEFAQFVKEYAGIEYPEDENRTVEKSGNSYYPEDMAADYLEEISHYIPMDEEEIEDALDIRDEEAVEKVTKTFMPVAANLAFKYLKAGIDYVELVQEGNIGLLKAISHYNSEDVAFSKYVQFWIVREMLTYLKISLETIKNSYRAFLKGRKEQLQNKEAHTHELHEDEEIHPDEETLTAEDILHSEETVSAKEKILEEKIVLAGLPYKLSLLEEQIIELYYGLKDNRRYSIYEIEEQLSLPKDQGEEMFYRALEKLSSGGGRMFDL